jgi:drug/metabolite transporter (DMT)-like permease
MKAVRGSLLVVGGTLFWGMSAVVAKILFTEQSGGQNVGALILVQTRVTFSCIALLAFFLFIRPEILRVSVGDLPRFALMGVVGIAGSNFTYYFAIQEINVSTAILMQYTAPLLVLAYAAISKEESLGGWKVAAAGLSILGCFLAVGGGKMPFSELSRLGLLAGVGAAVCWAFANVYMRRLLKAHNVWTILTYSFLASSIFWLVVHPPHAIVAAEYSVEQWVQFFGFALISVLIPHSLYFSGVRFITASRAIITATFEPIVAIAGSFLILSEVLSLTQIVGALIVIAAIAVLQIRQEDSVIATPAQRPVSSE